MELFNYYIVQGNLTELKRSEREIILTKIQRSFKQDIDLIRMANKNIRMIYKYYLEIRNSLELYRSEDTLEEL